MIKYFGGSVMKIKVLTAVLGLLILVSAYSGGNMELVNTQEIGLDNIETITILCRNENVDVLKGTSGTLIVKEYMSENNRKYYANIGNSGNTITIETGQRPLKQHFNLFKARMEVFLPASYENTINIKTIDGNICCEYINGNIFAESLDGDIELKLINGVADVKTKDGNIRCTVTENVGDISLIAEDGNVQLHLPNNLKFKFSTRIADGSLSTPFGDRLFSPMNDKKLVEGIIGGDNIPENSPRISIRTNDGSVKVNWIN
jgi:hypothetical protein